MSHAPQNASDLTVIAIGASLRWETGTVDQVPWATACLGWRRPRWRTAGRDASKNRPGPSVLYRGRSVALHLRRVSRRTRKNHRVERPSTHLHWISQTSPLKCLAALALSPEVPGCFCPQSPLALAREALAAGQRALPAQSCRCSRKDAIARRQNCSLGDLSACRVECSWPSPGGRAPRPGHVTRPCKMRFATSLRSSSSARGLANRQCKVRPTDWLMVRPCDLRTRVGLKPRLGDRRRDGAPAGAPGAGRGSGRAGRPG